jgi:hypothetical protein
MSAPAVLPTACCRKSRSASGLICRCARRAPVNWRESGWIAGRYRASVGSSTETGGRRHNGPAPAPGGQS